MAMTAYGRRQAHQTRHSQSDLSKQDHIVSVIPLVSRSAFVGIGRLDPLCGRSETHDLVRLPHSLLRFHLT